MAVETALAPFNLAVFWPTRYMLFESNKIKELGPYSSSKIKELGPISCCKTAKS